MLSLDALLWAARVWAVAVGSAALPCVLIVASLRKMEGRTGRYLTREYWQKGIESVLLMALVMSLPAWLDAETIGGLSPALVLLLIWMAERLVKAYSTWAFGLQLMGRLNGK